MVNPVNRDLLSVGAFLLILVVSIVLGMLNVIGWFMVPSLLIVLWGCWMLALAGMQSSNPEKYGRSAFGLTGWGLLFVALGGAWFAYGYGWLYSLLIILAAFAALAIAAALKRK
jgi:hypothetical protein